MKNILKIISTLTLLIPQALYAKVDKDVNVAKVQAMLAELCYEPGIVDGAWGKKTETAVKAFFTKHYRKYDGNFDVNDANFILSAGASAKAFGSASVKKCLVVYSDRIGNSLNNAKIKQITQKVANKNEADKFKLSNAISKKNKYNNTGVILLSENFENSKKLKVDDRDNNWVIEKENKNSIYCNKVKSKWTDFNFGRRNWSDYSISFKMKFITENGGKVETHIRKTNRKYYMAEIRQFGSKASIEILNNRSYSDVKLTDWLEVKLIAIGSEINLLINNKPVISASDELLDQGGGMIAVSANSKVCIDDLVVRSYDKPKISDKGKSYNNGAELPERVRPDDATISLYQDRRLTFIEQRRQEGRLYTIKPIGNASKFEQVKNLSSKTLDRALKKGYFLSYLYYDNGIIKYDGVAEKGRFDQDVNDQMLFYTHSTGKSITSYILGHAICEGYINSIDEIIDWPLMEDTLYQGQPIINLLNMNAGDRHTVNGNSSNRVMGSQTHHRDMGLNKIGELLAGTKKRGNNIFYNNVLADIIANYIVFRSGDSYNELMRKVFQDKVKIAYPVSYEKHNKSFTSGKLSGFNGRPETLASYSFFMSRLDFLRVAEAMMLDYQNETCVGKYLKTSQAQAKKWYKYRPNKERAQLYLHNYAKKYGSQFYFDFHNMSKRNIIGTEGYNGQNMLIDLDNSRIVVTNSAATGWDMRTYMLNVIRNGKLPQ